MKRFLMLIPLVLSLAILFSAAEPLEAQQEEGLLLDYQGE